MFLPPVTPSIAKTTSTAFLAALALGIIACSNSEPVGFDTEDAFSVYRDSTKKSNFTTTSDSGTIVSEMPPHDTIKEYLPLNDSEYPYSGIPRIVIETENHREIKDRETKIPAKLQIWGKKAPESEIMELTIRGRGNSSWKYMPKKSYKIEFLEKQELLGMRKDKDWALVANYADKTLMKNYVVSRLAKGLGVPFTPCNTIVELYLNKEYLGVFLLTETIKVGKNRINISQKGNSYLVEVDSKYRNKDQVIFTSLKKPLNVHYPKVINQSSLDTLLSFINKFEEFLQSIDKSSNSEIDKWIDVDKYILHYWIQEFTKNPDANFFTSVYFTWSTGNKISMGPVWDFDLAFGGHDTEVANLISGYRIRDSYWNKYLFKDTSFSHTIKTYWDAHKADFYSILDTIDYYHPIFEKPAKNNFKRWDILGSTENSHHPKAYASYSEAVQDLKNWITERYNWLDARNSKN